jgi:hypothetical protein
VEDNIRALMDSTLRVAMETEEAVTESSHLTVNQLVSLFEQNNEAVNLEEHNSEENLENEQRLESEQNDFGGEENTERNFESGNGRGDVVSMDVESSTSQANTDDSLTQRKSCRNTLQARTANTFQELSESERETQTSSSQSSNSIRLDQLFESWRDPKGSTSEEFNIHMQEDTLGRTQESEQSTQPLKFDENMHGVEPSRLLSREGIMKNGIHRNEQDQVHGNTQNPEPSISQEFSVNMQKAEARGFHASAGVVELFSSQGSAPSTSQEFTAGTQKIQEGSSQSRVNTLLQDVGLNCSYRIVKGTVLKNMQGESVRDTQGVNASAPQEHGVSMHNTQENVSTMLNPAHMNTETGVTQGEARYQEENVMAHVAAPLSPVHSKG